MSAFSCTTTPFLLVAPAFLLLLLYFSAFNKQPLTTTTIFSSYSLKFHQENLINQTYTPILSPTSNANISSVSTLNISSTSTSNIPSTSNSTQSNNDFSNISGTTNTTTEVINISDVPPLINEKSSLEKIEEGLARARNAIREAVHTRNYTSQKEEDFIPRGSMYRNSYAFHQSHIEMEKRFKVWTYKEGEPPLVHDGPLNLIYSTEGQFIDEMESGKNPMLAKHPDEAHVFFLPFSVTNVVRYILKPENTYKRAQLQNVVEDYIGVVANKYPYWNRSTGADHFMVSCHDWAPDVNDAHPELFKHLVRVLCNANVSEGFQAQRDVSLPEINLPFGRLGGPKLGQRVSKRRLLAFFAGGAHGYIRKILLEHWKDKDNEVQVHEYLPKGINYQQLMGQAKFCLCPSGYEVASPRVVEAIHAGCVPVLISKDYIPPFSDVLDWSQFSVQIPIEKIPDIKTILQAIPDNKYIKMQKRVTRVQIHFELNRPSKRFDVIHMLLHSVWLRRLNLGLKL
ncbi:hypothetical protein IFM89_019675 [Coptis chinensis]|uniref:Exostosin GT47 domain-containing protein n=1 Tax=Coptis chinensis TaxID=261450 RepID=A0A835LQR1_9MAGN|nr:hypothetical protein IFM89_019675 [Coptis chinensis]